MRIIVVVLLILLVGCKAPDTTVSTTTTAKKNNSNLYTSHSKSSIYARYKNTNNRYTINQDAAPIQQDQLNFKEPVPAKEPLSRYGNPVEYDVDGHTYRVMKSSSGYKTRGVASWYGTKFHKQRTSSGEPYNMYVMTAAHKTLPLPTYIKVKNLDNGRSAVVKVNDRGPFHSDRVVDLSYAAALKLGVFPKGTANVEIETLMGPAGVAHYYLQAGAFASEVSAKRLREQLARITPSPVFIEHYKQHFVVRVGPFADKSMSDKLKLKLAQNGVKGAFSVLV